MRKQLLDLRHDLFAETNVVILVFNAGKVPVVVPGGAGAVFRIAQIAAAVLLMPVQILRIVKAQLHAVFIAGLGQLGDHVAAKGRRVAHIEAAGLGAEQRKALVVLRGDDEIVHAALLRQANPLVGAEVDGIEHGSQPAVFGVGNPLMGLDPLGVGAALAAAVFAAQQRVKPPVDHHAVFALEPFAHIHGVKLPQIVISAHGVCLKGLADGDFGAFKAAKPWSGAEFPFI